MFGLELAVQEHIAADDQPGDEVRQRHLAGVPGGREHALAEESTAETDTVETADQNAVLAAFDTVGEASIMELAIKVANRIVDPGVRMARSRIGAGRDHRVEIGVGGDLVGIAADGSGQPLRQMKLARDDHAAALGLDEKYPRIVACFAHGEDAKAITVDQVVGGEASNHRATPRL